MKLLRKLRALFRREKLEAEMADEMRLHVELQAERNIAAGMSPVDARHAALRMFGNVASLQERAREGRGWFWLEQCLADLRFAGRVLAKQWIFTFIAVLTLAVGIGASSAIVGVMRTHVFDPVPGDDEDRLVDIVEEPVFSRDRGRSGTSLYVAHQLRQRPQVFDQITTFTITGMSVEAGDFFQDVRGADVDEGFFALFGAHPLLGRGLVAEDWQAGAGEHIVISHRWWQKHYGGEPGVIGQQARVRPEEAKAGMPIIVGVMPPKFRFPAGDCDYWRPLRPRAADLAQPRAPNYRLFARLAPGVSHEKAQAALDVLRVAIVNEFSPVRGATFKLDDRLLRLRPLLEFFVEAKVRRSVWVVAVAAAVVLLIVCTNLALLQLARGEARKSEMAVRVALGAGRGRLLRQLLIENLLLAAAGGLGGLVLAHGLRRLGDALLPTYAPVLQPAGIDGLTLAWTLGVAGVCGILFGFFPAWRVGDVRPAQVLQNTARTASGGVGQRWFQRGLVAAQVALAMMLLCAAGLLLRSMVSLLKSDRGIDTSGLAVVQPMINWSEFRTAEHRANVSREIAERLAALPSTVSAGLAGGWMGLSYFREDGREPIMLMQTDVSVGAQDFARTLRLRLKAGRWFAREDDQPGMRTVVVNATAASALWPGESALGKRIYRAAGQTGPAGQNGAEVYEVVGVVEDIRFWSLEMATHSMMFFPSRRKPEAAREFYLRSTLTPAALCAEVNRICKEVIAGPRQPQVEWLEETLYASTAPRRMMMWSALALAGVGLFLAMLGVFGVQLRAVTGRIREIGIRMALGADRESVVRMVLKQGMAIVLAGVVIGTGGSLWLTRAMAGLLHGVPPQDPVTFALAPLLLGAVALLACWLPARRAAKVDPMVALRAE